MGDPNAQTKPGLYAARQPPPPGSNEGAGSDEILSLHNSSTVIRLGFLTLAPPLLLSIKPILIGGLDLTSV